MHSNPEAPASNTYQHNCCLGNQNFNFVLLLWSIGTSGKTISVIIDSSVTFVRTKVAGDDTMLHSAKNEPAAPSASQQ